MSDYKTPSSQIKASQEYRKRISTDEEKRAHRNYMNGRRNARSFIKKAKVEDLQEMKQLIAERENELQTEKTSTD
ncbi:hypothetical protein NRIC_04150 [Enterococcus florum]|uniref:Uncharacterized protein n=1 Tax=Enterococcus florum TaxID=2480627 RepID=A0A4P5P8C8_9ENTE|nr:hypothetical protein [Enterococcus florum]GCF92524.1 hypothetical protein NRIC_04150 [Enterococcus florum]